jgi:hypothetical protein
MIEDLFYLERQAYQDSFLHRLDARVKILVSFAVIIAIVAVPYSPVVFPAAGVLFLDGLAADDGGLTSTSAPVNVTVRDQPPLSIVEAIRFNPQTGLFEQTVRVSNPTDSTFDGVRIYIHGLTNTIHVYNASGVTNGVPYVQSSASVPPGGSVDFVIEYYVTSGGLVPDPNLVVTLVAPDPGGTATLLGTGVHINRGIMLPNWTYLIEFATIANRQYVVEYSSDLKTWKQTQQPPITGNGSWVQWIDNGQPKTDSLPSSVNCRYYRVILLR